MAVAHRVLSLLPAAAETLWWAGGLEYLVGRGHEDDYPPDISRLPIVTGAKIKFTTSAEVDAAVCASVEASKTSTGEDDDQGLYSLNVPLIKELKPTVIITQGLCSVCAVSQPMVMKIAHTLDPPPEVVSLSPVTVEDIIHDVIRIGKAVGLEESATAAAEALTARLEKAKKLGSSLVEEKEQRPNICLMEWTEPIYVGGHWTPQIIHYAGGRHPLNPPITEGGPAGLSITRTREEVAASDPDWIIVCPCGLDLETTRRELGTLVDLPWWKGLRAVKEGKVVLVDGHQMFSRSSLRVVDALEFLLGLLYDRPELIPKDFPWEPLAK